MSVDRQKFESFMQEARLETSTGDLVERVWLMPFVKPAEIVKWGQRYFIWHKTGTENPPVLIYREGMLTFTVDPDTGTIRP